MRLVVIGAGPGGYEAAIKAAKLGAKVSIIEKDKVGGTCLNRGCIPTKSLLASSDVFGIVNNAQKFGVNITGQVSADFSEMMNRKNKLVSQMVNGIEFLLKKNGIEIIKGVGKLIDKNLVEVTKDDGSKEILRADKIILATGSIPVCPGLFNYDGKYIITSDEVLNLEKIPDSMIIVGGGVIGCEIGQFLRRLGTEVTIVEMMPQILPMEDEDVAKQLIRQFKKDKIKIITGKGITSVKVENNRVIAGVENTMLEADMMMVSIGRKPFTEELGLENAGIETDKRGRIPVNRKLETCAEGIYAIGDIIDTPFLAHVASKEGVIAAENALGGDKEVAYHAVPRCVYTEPEVAAVGLTESELKVAAKAYKIGTFDFRGLGKAQVIDKIQGFVKVITDENDKLIGASVVGPNATDLLAELTLAVHLGLSAEQVGDVIHPHPTLSEAIMEALHDVHGQSVHKV
ncbi:Dihydrolipoyl dehydrogenase [Tepidanaerobacter acetatoxydans Re1]|uniref:Dihydrolipoyl dehydrogenase n=1 Tax=Tepidanaerobacter acetatoxydans (strain DSM 21804 / JCM 16047 / Re1) TaxID=1209989 RepID=F4LTI0_TEPAE|nr:dihydrolipoyl dehydrogenase [Tepidanaerobacter acetatoxydans]AEE90511.1 dihydrolipoamide dehydrogenase [Tepidanaerobacter acetatoxydans Re1]CCP25020.1 Dihydrolipoyl dehydrogenase [Tepidanaerobacter acetatoxydans Re1]